MQNLNIGQRVRVTGLSVAKETPHGPTGSFNMANVHIRSYDERPLRQPVYGIICGLSRRPTGKTRWHGEGPDWTQTGSVLVWEVKLGWLNKPILVPDSGLKKTRAKFVLPKKAQRPCYASV